MNKYKEAFAIISIIENMEAMDALSVICTSIDAISYKMNIPSSDIISMISKLVSEVNEQLGPCTEKMGGIVNITVKGENND